MFQFALSMKSSLQLFILMQKCTLITCTPFAYLMALMPLDGLCKDFDGTVDILLMAVHRH